MMTIVNNSLRISLHINAIKPAGAGWSMLLARRRSWRAGVGEDREQFPAPPGVPEADLKLVQAGVTLAAWKDSSIVQRRLATRTNAVAHRCGVTSHDQPPALEERSGRLREGQLDQGPRRSSLSRRSHSGGELVGADSGGDSGGGRPMACTYSAMVQNFFRQIREHPERGTPGSATRIDPDEPPSRLLR
jgi:hypothetical protein